MGISNHPDHITIRGTAVKAFDRYRVEADREPRFFYVAILGKAARCFELYIDIGQEKVVKVRALRIYKFQEDAQHLADMFEAEPFDIEGFHQAFPPVPDGRVDEGFWT